jgi:hypothetical protein
MRKFDALGMAGTVMLLTGAITFMGQGSFVPLWVAWTVGPLLWYLGFAISIVWAFCRFFAQPVEAQEHETTPVIVVERRIVTPQFGHGPVGVTHEIPAMDGFIW